MSFYTVFGKDNCQYCAMAIEDLQDCGHMVITHHIEKDHALRNLLLIAGLKTVPQVFSPEGYHIGGYYDLVEWLIEKEMDDSDDPY